MRGSDTCDPNTWDAREACQPGLQRAWLGGTQWLSFSLSRKTTHRASLDYTVRPPFPKPKKLVWEEGPMRATDSLALLHLKLWLIPFLWERVKPPGSVQHRIKDQITSSVKDQRVNSSGCESQQSVSLHNHCVVKVKGLSMTRQHKVQLHAGWLWLTHPEDAQTLTRKGLNTLSPVKNTWLSESAGFRKLTWTFTMLVRKPKHYYTDNKQSCPSP